MNTTLELSQTLFVLFTGLSPSEVLHSSKFKLTNMVFNESQPHLLYITIKDSVCLVLSSVALTNSISFDFFSYRY